MGEPSRYDNFAACFPDAVALIGDLCAEVGHHDQCGTLNPAVAYCLRQVGISTIMVTGDMRCPGATIERMEAGGHVWCLAHDGRTCWHVDLANHFLTASWYRDNLPPEQWFRVARGMEPGPAIPLVPKTFVWGTMAERGILLDVATLCAFDPFFDVLPSVGKREAVRDLFRKRGFADPYAFQAGVLALTDVSPPA